MVAVVAVLEDVSERMERVERAANPQGWDKWSDTSPKSRKAYMRAVGQLWREGRLDVVRYGVSGNNEDRSRRPASSPRPSSICTSTWACPLTIQVDGLNQSDQDVLKHALRPQKVATA